MIATKAQKSEKLKLRREIADWMLLGAIPFYTEARQQTRSILMGKGQEYVDAVHRLVLKGCDPIALHTVLDLGEALKQRVLDHKVPKVPNAKTLKALAKRMRGLAKDIGAIERSRFLTILNRKEAAKFYAETKLNMELVDDLSTTFPYVALPKWLEKRASMYEEWLRLASQKVPPKAVGLAKLSRVCVSLYVKYATSRTFFPEVLNLLELANLGQCSPTQLSRETKDFETDYPLSCSSLVGQFQMLHPRNRKSRKMIAWRVPVNC
jgi:hypothetical protein